MKYQDIIKLTAEECSNKLQKEQETLEKLKLTHRINPIEKPMRIRHTRKLIARLQTAQTAQKNKKNA